MNIRVIGSTHPGYNLEVEDAKLFAGHSAGICYMKDDFDTILTEPEEKTLKRFKQTAGSGHHSVAGHTSYNLLFVGIPKILAMILNNEKDYNTSEKSARYTKMTLGPDEQALYDKWLHIFERRIRDTYPRIEDMTRTKLAQENARYFISVFTPSTTMEYTVDFRQGNYLIGFLEDYALEIAKSPDLFDKKLLPWLLEAASAMKQIFDCPDIRDKKGRRLSLFAPRARSEYFGEVYSVNYVGSFAELAQAQRHRSINYEMSLKTSGSMRFFVPPILEDNLDLVEDYLRDMNSVADNFPQGTLVKINERGTLEDFVTSKCTERLCGAAQLEICRETDRTLHRYVENATAAGDTEIFRYLNRILNKTKCQFTEQICTRRCPLGPENALDRKI